MGNQSSKDLSDKPVVLVIGGGYAGLTITQALEKKFNVVVIDRKDYFFHNIAALRPVAEPDYERLICIPYDRAFKRASIIKGDAVAITPTHVRVHGHDHDITFDYLVICTGTSYAFPAKVPFERATQVQELYHALRSYIFSDQCRDILIVGGGPVGIELAGELATNAQRLSRPLSPREAASSSQAASSSTASDGQTTPATGAAKQFTLIHAADTLVSTRPDLSPKLSRQLQAQLERLGVRLLLGERLDFESIATAASSNAVAADEDEASNNNDTPVLHDAPSIGARYVTGRRTVRTSSGREIETDLIFFCNGAQVNCSSYRDAFAHVRTERGELRVNEHLQVEGYRNIFAIGDCSNADQKMGYLAGEQAKLAAQNISLLAKAEHPALKSYSPAPPVMLVPIGRNGGATQLPVFGVFGKTTTSLIKGNKLFIDRYWQLMGYPSPPKEFVAMQQQQLTPEQADKRKNIATALGCPEDQVDNILYNLPSRELDPQEEHL